MKCSFLTCVSLLLVICITDRLTSVSGQDTRYVQRTAVNSYENYSEMMESLVAEILFENRQLKTKLDELRKQCQPATTRHIISARLNQSVTFSNGVVKVAARSSKLYVSYFNGPTKMGIYNESTFSLQRVLNVTGLGCIYDMASCPDCDVIFISDDCKNMIHVIDDVGQLRTQWNVSDMPVGVSVNSQSNVIVTFYTTHQLREYTPNGRLVREITLQSDVNYPTHAIQLDNDRYVVSHGVSDNKVDRVCIVNGNGAVVQCYGGERGSGVGQLDNPYHLALFGESLLVAEYGNERVVHLNVSSLTYIGELINTSIEGCQPWQLTLNEDGTRLYVLHSDSTSCPMKVFDLITA